MARPSHLAVALLALVLGRPAGALPELTDVPKTHWARSAVEAVVRRGIMAAPGGKFDGARLVTRGELVITLANFARTLEKRQWSKDNPVPVGKVNQKAKWENATVSRYELAALVARMAPYILQALPPDTGKVYGTSEALPPKAKVTGVPKSNPAYAALVFLTERRYLFKPSVLLKPGPQPVTGAQVSDGLTMLTAGIVDRYTDEPLLRDQGQKPPVRPTSPAEPK